MAHLIKSQRNVKRHAKILARLQRRIKLFKNPRVSPKLQLNIYKERDSLQVHNKSLDFQDFAMFDI